MDLQIAMFIIQLLLGLVIAGLGWWLSRTVTRLDKHSARLSSLETFKAETVVKLDAAPTAETLRNILREELDRALGPIQREMADVQTRLRGVERQGDG